MDRSTIRRRGTAWSCWLRRGIGIARAAVENGADAVYFGLDAGFNARARATNISLESLDELMAFLHGRQVRGYLTLNTLVFSDELPNVEAIVRRVAAAGVDAVLVQDLGLARLVRAICPRLAIHASTQMTLTSAETIRAIENLGIERVVLAPSCRSTRSARSGGRRRCRWRCSFTGRCAWPIRANA